MTARPLPFAILYFQDLADQLSEAMAWYQSMDLDITRPDLYKPLRQAYQRTNRRAYLVNETYRAVGR